MQNYLSWVDVRKVHRQPRSLNFKEGRIKSLMFSLDRRRYRLNEVRGDELLFYFPDDFQYDLLKKVKEGEPFIVFRKVTPNKYFNAGLYKVKKISKGMDKRGKPSLILSVIPNKA